VRQLDIALDPAFGGSKVLDVVSGRSFTVGSPEPSASAAPAATPLPPPPTPAPTPVVGVSGVEWADSPGTTIDGNVTMIVSLGGRFHALGSHYDGSLSTPAIWSSADGSAWVRTFLPRPDGSEHRYVGVSSLLSLEGRLVAIGAVSISDYAETVVWESADGRTWTEVDTGAFRGEGVAPTDASTGPSGIVVTTAKYIPTDDSVWRSRDGGRTWTEHRPAGEHVIVGPIVGTQQGYVLGGATADDEWGDTSHPAIWTSQDGTNWRAATVEGAGGRGAVVHVTVDGSGRWAAIGTLNDRTVIWRSADRERWTVTADLGSATVRYSSGYRLTGAPGGFIAFHATEPAVTWTSEDGVTWKSQEDSLFGRFAPAADIGWTEGIARIDERVMVVGGTLGSDGWLPWVGTIRR
jgi:hypothetical protein